MSEWEGGVVSVCVIETGGGIRKKRDRERWEDTEERKRERSNLCIIGESSWTGDSTKCATEETVWVTTEA